MESYEYEKEIQEYENQVRECHAEIRRLRAAIREVQDERNALENVLFEQTRDALKVYLEGGTEDDGSVSAAQAKHSVFCALYGVIEKSELEGAYQGWKTATLESPAPEPTVASTPPRRAPRL